MNIKRTIISAPLDHLGVDHAVQRAAIDEGRVNRLAADFNPNALGALTVSLRPDGALIILDGMHRWTAAKTVGYKGKATCIQYEGLDLADEAALFLSLNNTKQVQAVDKFRVRVIAEDKAAVEMNEILTRHGWKAAVSSCEWRMSAVTAFEKVYNGAGVRVSGGNTLADNTLHVITAAWAGQPNSAHSVILASLGKFLGWYGIEVDTSKVIRELSAFRPMNFVADVKATGDIQHCDLSNAGARILVNLHNKKRRTNLLAPWQNR
jgi:hypothetical protein